MGKGGLRAHLEISEQRFLYVLCAFDERKLAEVVNQGYTETKRR